MEEKINQTEMQFIADLTAMVLNVIKNSKKYPTMRNDVVKNGHFPYRIFNETHMAHMLTANWIRMIMNMGMMMTPKDFMDFWMNLGRRILRVKELTNIKQKQYYYKVLVEAERRGVIIKTYDKYHRVAIMLSH